MTHLLSTAFSVLQKYFFASFFFYFFYSYKNCFIRKLELKEVIKQGNTFLNNTIMSSNTVIFKLKKANKSSCQLIGTIMTESAQIFSHINHFLSCNFSSNFSYLKSCIGWRDGKRSVINIWVTMSRNVVFGIIWWWRFDHGYYRYVDIRAHHKRHKESAKRQHVQHHPRWNHVCK